MKNKNQQFAKGGIINPEQYNNKSDWENAIYILESITTKWINFALRSDLDTHIIARVAIMQMSKN